MTRADYASCIKGFRLLSGESGYQYQTTADFSLESATRLLTDLPAQCEVSFFDPEAKQEESWIFVRRVGSHFRVMRASRGFSKWKDESLERVIEMFLACPLVKKPLDDFDSFRVDLIVDAR